MTKQLPAQVFVVLLLGLAAPVQVGAGDWLRFRGPNGDGHVPGSEPGPVAWDPGTNLKWKAELPGPGSSCPILVGDRVYVTCWSGYGVDRSAPGDQANLRRHLVCIDRAAGETVWDKSVAAYLPEDEYGGMFAEHGYASHTPVSDGSHIYAFFGKTGVVKFDLDGNQIWTQSVGTESGANNWGSASSPILYEGLVIVPATAESEALVALDKETGEEIWRQEASGFNSVWGTPVLARVDDARTDLVIAVPNEIWGFNPTTGKLRWYCKGVEGRSFCSSAIAHDGVVYAIESGPGGGGGVAVRAGGEGDVTDTHVAWSGRQRNRIGTPLYFEGRIYTFGGGVANCIDAETGEQVYQARLRSSGGSGGRRSQDYASPVLAGGIIYYPSRSGDIFVIKPGDEYLQLGVNRVTSDSEDFSATPAVADGDLYLRSSESLYCVTKGSNSSDALTQAVESARLAADQTPAEQPEEEPSRSGRRRFDPAELFRNQDTDGDGKLYGDEITGRLKDNLSEVDTDGDSAVTQEEFLAGMRRMFQRGDRGRRGRGDGGRRRGDQQEPAKPSRPQRPPLETPKSA